MAVIKKRAQQEPISKTRAVKASFLTLLTVLVFAIGIFHVWWSVKAFYHDRFGSRLYNVVVILGGLLLNAFVSIKSLVYLETRILSDGIDSDHKKYI